MQQRVVPLRSVYHDDLFLVREEPVERQDSHLVRIAAREAECKAILMPLLRVYLRRNTSSSQPILVRSHLFFAIFCCYLFLVQMGAHWTPTLIFVSINLRGLFGSLVVIY